MDKLVGTGTDGASVMLGSQNGVVQRLRHRTGRMYLIAVHCSAHRLELAYKDSSKNIKLYQCVETLLLNLFLFYRNSPLNRSNLKASFATFGREALMPVRAGGTRWLAHMQQALNNTLKGYGPIKQHLNQVINSNYENNELLFFQNNNCIHVNEKLCRKKS